MLGRCACPLQADNCGLKVCSSWAVAGAQRQGDQSPQSSEAIAAALLSVSNTVAIDGNSVLRDVLRHNTPPCPPLHTHHLDIFRLWGLMPLFLAENEIGKLLDGGEAGAHVVHSRSHTAVAEADDIKQSAVFVNLSAACCRRLHAYTIKPSSLMLVDHA